MIALVVCTNVGVLAIPADARPEYEICVHYDVDLTLHCANLPHIKKINIPPANDTVLPVYVGICCRVSRKQCSSYNHSGAYNKCSADTK